MAFLFRRHCGSWGQERWRALRKLASDKLFMTSVVLCFWFWDYMSTNYIIYFSFMYAFCVYVYSCVWVSASTSFYGACVGVRGQFPFISPKVCSTLCLRQAGDPGLSGTHLFSASHLMITGLAGVPYHTCIFNMSSWGWKWGSYTCNVSILQSEPSPPVQSIKLKSWKKSPLLVPII